MKKLQHSAIIVFSVLMVLSVSSCGIKGLFTKTKDLIVTPDAKTLKIRKQNEIYAKFSISLRAAHTAYNVNRYDLAIPKFEKAIQEGWLDGIDLYQYADCLANTGKKNESVLYFQKALNELSEFYPDHVYVEKLKANGYKISGNSEQK